MSPIFRILYRIYRIFSWSRYTSARRFTAAGLMVLGCFIGSVVTGLDTENTVAYQASTPLLFLLLLAVAFSWSFRARFSATRVLPRLGTAGKSFSYRVIATNLTSRTQQGLTMLENLTDSRPSFEEWRAVQVADEKRFRASPFRKRRRINPFKMATAKEAAVPSVGPKAQVEVSVELTPLHRGVLRFTGLTLARTDPLGLFRAFTRVNSPQSVLILPRRYPLPPMALPGAMKYQEGGVALASNIGQSDEFFSLRDYRRGDPFRHIHWRSWAKTGKPIVKEFEDEFFVRHALVLDTFSDDPRGEAFEEAVSVAASFACTVPTQESLLDLLFIGAQAYCFTSGRGLAHADQMLEILASVQACGDKPFRTLEHLVFNHTTSVSGCICVLLGWDGERQAFVQKLRALGIPVLVLIVVEPEDAKWITPGPMASDPEHFRVLEVGHIEEGVATL